jgi:hypothetical protein
LEKRCKQVTRPCTPSPSGHPSRLIWRKKTLFPSDPGLLPQVGLAAAHWWRKGKKLRIQIVGSIAISRTVSFRIARTLMLGAKGKKVVISGGETMFAGSVAPNPHMWRVTRESLCFSSSWPNVCRYRAVPSIFAFREGETTFSGYSKYLSQSAICSQTGRSQTAK